MALVGPAAGECGVADRGDVCRLVDSARGGRVDTATVLEVAPCTPRLPAPWPGTQSIGMPGGVMREEGGGEEV